MRKSCTLAGHCDSGVSSIYLMPASFPERERLLGDRFDQAFFHSFSLDTTVVNKPPYLGNVYLKASLSTTAKANQ